MDIRYLSLLSLFLEIQTSFADILQRQKRNWIIETFTIDEAYTGPFPYNVGKIKVEKNYTNFEIHGQGVELEPYGLLSINSYSGIVTVQEPVDCEKFDILKVTFKAQNREKKQVVQLGVLITIIDSNDNPPKCSQDSYEITVKESTLQGFDLISLQATDVDRSEDNNNFTLQIVSVDPKPQDLEFYLKQLTDVGTIWFKGCLDYEKAKKYTIVVEAKDSGNPMPLSSTCKVIINIEDGNNHLPVITKQTDSRKVKEGEQNVLVSRLQVKDKDAKGSKAWKAKYRIHGDTNNNFRITTDPDTNEGLLYVQKPLDYEEEPMKNLTITVENEIPYFSCRVVDKTNNSLWKTDVITRVFYTGAVYESSTNELPHSLSFGVTVEVEDINEPPVFEKPEKRITLSENVQVGKYLETFTAINHDTSSKAIRYLKGEDPANWVTVDAISGTIKTLKNLDRESPMVKNGVYVVTICAVDDGEPPQTSTATLSIYITDENDNLPYLFLNRIDMCLSDKPSLSNITALDLDGDPYGGPFRFSLLGDVKDKWTIEPMIGYSVTLVKEGNVFSGYYELLLKVSDLQGKAAVHNLTVTVCGCLDHEKPNCMARKATRFTISGVFLAIAFFSVALVAGILLFSLVLSCKKDKVSLPSEFSEQLLMPSNIEEPGTDCMVMLPPVLKCGKREQTAVKSQDQTVLMKQATVVSNNNAMTTTAVSPGSSEKGSESQSQTFCRRSTQAINLPFERAASNLGLSHQQRKASIDGSVHLQRKNSKCGDFAGCHQKDFQRQNILYQKILLKKALMAMMANQMAPAKELCDYEPHVYSEEGESEHNYDLDVISIPEDSSDTDWDLDCRFSTLASIIMPSNITALHTKTFNTDH